MIIRKNSLKTAGVAMYTKYAPSRNRLPLDFNSIVKYYVWDRNSERIIIIIMSNPTEDRYQTNNSKNDFHRSK